MRAAPPHSRLELIPLPTPKQTGPFDLFRIVVKTLRRTGQTLREGDVLVVSSKFAGMAEGRVVNLATLDPGRGARALAAQLDLSPPLAELVLREADAVYGGVPGFALAVKDRLLAPNAGIDKSNVAPGHAILYPARPFDTARLLQQELRFHLGARIGVVLADSRLMPTRIGTTGVAVAVAGFEPVRDERGRRDLFGNILRVTQRALADDLASAAQLLMGEADERIPLVLVRGAAVTMTDRELSVADLAVEPDTCIYVRGLGSGRLPGLPVPTMEGIPR